MSRPFALLPSCWSSHWRSRPLPHTARRPAAPRQTGPARSRTSPWPARTASARREPRLEGLVHGRRRRAERRLLPDQRQHQQRDAAVRRHRRLDVHRPADARHDLHGPGARQPSADVPRDGEGQERPLPDRHRLPDRPRAPDGHPAAAVSRRSRAARATTSSTSASTRTSTATAAAGRQRRRRTPARSPVQRSHVLVGSDTVTATNAANRDYAQPVYSRAGRHAASPRSPTATRARPATGSRSSTPTPR